MRILHIIYDDIDNPWLGGGGATRTLEIYSRIARRGHRVTVLCGGYPGAPRTRSRQGITYRHTRPVSSYSGSRLAFILSAPFLIKRGGYDIVIEDVSPFSPIGSPLWNRRVPAVASVQNLSGRHAIHKYGLRGLLPKLVERPLLSLFQNFIAVSPGIAAEIRRVRGPRSVIRVIPNSAGEHFPLYAAAAQSAQETPYILSLGRVDVYQKGLDLLIQAFCSARSHLPGTRLVIAGSGTMSETEQLAALVTGSGCAEDIDIIGQVGRAEAAKLMRGALMLAMPSRYEAWPLTAIEAGASGTPVVGFDIVGVRDAAPEYPKGHGYLVPAGDVTALAEAMVKIATMAELRQEVGAQGRTWSARFSWDALAAEQLGYYEELIRVKRARRA